MSVAGIPVFSVVEQFGARITLRSHEGYVAHLFVLEEDIVRVMVLPQGILRFPRTWAIAPGLEDIPYEGRDRFDHSGFATPDFELVQGLNEMRITTAFVRL